MTDRIAEGEHRLDLADILAIIIAFALTLFFFDKILKVNNTCGTPLTPSWWSILPYALGIILFSIISPLVHLAIKKWRRVKKK